MLDKIMDIIKILAPCIVAGAVVRYINATNEKKLQEWSDTDTEKYEIAYPAVIYIIMYIGSVFFVGILIWCYLNNELSWFTGIGFGFMALLSITSVMGTHIWKIWVNGEQIIYRDYFGIKHFYTFDDITKATKCVDGALIVYSGKKRLFKIDNNLSFSRLYTQLCKHNIPSDVAGMTVHHFKLKPRMVYHVCSVLFVFTAGLVLYGFYQATNSFNPFCWYTLVVVIGTVAFLVDIFTDRLYVDGKNICRRRWFFVKKFTFDELDGIKRSLHPFRENIEFYANGKKVATVWNLNEPQCLLQSKLCAEQIKVLKDKKKKKKGKKK